MSAIDELKRIVETDMYIHTEDLDVFVKRIETMYIQQAKKISRQQKQLQKFMEKESKGGEREWKKKKHTNALKN